MPDVKGRRTYTSPLREDQARATRRRVLDAARELFISQGYGATTIDHIAERSGVSKPTVFASVGNKAVVLRAVRDLALAGDDAPVAVAERPEVELIRAEPDRARAIRLLARRLTAVAERYGPIYEVLRAAAGTDAELRDLWETEERERAAAARAWVDILRAKSGSRISPDSIDLVWLLMAPDHHQRLVGGRGWTRARYERWLTGALANATA